MEKVSTSFWAEIKKFEDMLLVDQRSYCFAPLSDLYRKLGLLDDALNVAKRGIAIHPEYVGGYMALGRAFHEKGMKEESMAALQHVVKVTPDNLLAQKLLSQLYLENGDVTSAEKTLKVLLLLQPEEVEARQMLEALEKATDIKRESEQLIFRDEETVGEEGTDANANFSEAYGITGDTESVDIAESLMVGTSFVKDPLATVTVAELYVEQGFLERAIDVYRGLHQSHPDNNEIKKRLAVLLWHREENQAADENIGAVEVTDASVNSAGLEGTCSAGEGAFYSGRLSESSAVAILERWLENIKRGRNVH